MFRHLFKLIWNKKKQNGLLLFEMLVSFMVLFALFTFVIYYYYNYTKPMGFDYKNVWVVNYNTAQFGSSDSTTLFYETVRQTLKGMPQVTEATFTGDNVPFSQTTNTTGLNYNNKEIDRINNYTVEDSYRNVLALNVLKGRWFEKQDAVATNKPVVINASLSEALFGTDNPVGKLIGNDGDKERKKIIGVVNDIKAKGDYIKSGTAIYNRADTGSFRWLNRILIRVAPDADAAFESRLYKALASSMKNANVEIEHLADKRKRINKFIVIPMTVSFIVAGFLIINVALGLFGVLWYNINKRRSEIGLRRAIGATGRSIAKQLVGEALVLATLSLLVGSFFAVQFPLLNIFDLPATVYITALVLAIGSIYLLVTLCALYPGRQAAAIYPAVALHED